MSKRTVVLIILDGWGIGRRDQSNPLYVAELKNIEKIKSEFSSGCLSASGISVGLPWGEEGNSEVGHLNIGGGKVIYQNYPKISLAIRDKSFFKNETIGAAVAHAQKNNSALNIIGLLSEGNVHSSLEHLTALIKLAEKSDAPKIKLHLITDGRDGAPQSAEKLLGRIPFSEKTILASLGGRYYAMDRDKNWNRTKEYYQVIVGNGGAADDAKTHIQNAYKKNSNDEYVFPTLVGQEKNPILDGEAVFFFNFREDRMRQITETFIKEGFREFPIKKFSNLFIASMVNYDIRFNIPVAFKKDIVENPLSRILAEAGKIQFKIAETEKYAHITYFFNGEIEPPFQNEYRALIPSKRDINHNEHPEMMAYEITERLTEAIEEQCYDFILANYANPDIVAHTGDFEATVKAAEIIDGRIGEITDAVLAKNGVLIITSDHGNAERLINPETGEIETKHDPNPVPIYLIAEEFKRQKSEKEIIKSEMTPVGVLADVAPTILELLGVPKPKEMTGQNLLKFLIY